MSHLLTLKCTVLWRDLIGFLSSCLNGYDSVRLFNNILLTYVYSVYMFIDCLSSDNIVN